MWELSYYFYEISSTNVSYSLWNYFQFSFNLFLLIKQRFVLIKCHYYFTSILLTISLKLVLGCRLFSNKFFSFYSINTDFQWQWKRGENAYLIKLRYPSSKDFTDSRFCYIISKRPLLRTKIFGFCFSDRNGPDLSDWYIKK